mmetsp:Transcript_13161/g.17343  ORF Transcript_13161/g.17343 Transcript_13161/m.17343 type:complete len:210 (-) Transcript_13161:1101-1730(-)
MCSFSFWHSICASACSRLASRAAAARSSFMRFSSSNSDRSIDSSTAISPPPFPPSPPPTRFSFRLRFSRSNLANFSRISVIPSNNPPPSIVDASMLSFSSRNAISSSSKNLLASLACSSSSLSLENSASRTCSLLRASNFSRSRSIAASLYFSILSFKGLMVLQVDSSSKTWSRYLEFWSSSSFMACRKPCISSSRRLYRSACCSAAAA